MVSLLLVWVFPLLFSLSFALDITFNNSLSELCSVTPCKFHDKLNWIPSVVPTEDDSVFIIINPLVIPPSLYFYSNISLSSLFVQNAKLFITSHSSSSISSSSPPSVWVKNVTLSHALLNTSLIVGDNFFMDSSTFFGIYCEIRGTLMVDSNSLFMSSNALFLYFSVSHFHSCPIMITALVRNANITFYNGAEVSVLQAYGVSNITIYNYFKGNLGLSLLTSTTIMHLNSSSYIQSYHGDGYLIIYSNHVSFGRIFGSRLLLAGKIDLFVYGFNDSVSGWTSVSGFNGESPQLTAHIYGYYLQNSKHYDGDLVIDGCDARSSSSRFTLSVSGTLTIKNCNITLDQTNALMATNVYLWPSTFLIIESNKVTIVGNVINRGTIDIHWDNHLDIAGDLVQEENGLLNIVFNTECLYVAGTMKLAGTMIVEYDSEFLVNGIIPMGEFPIISANQISGHIFDTLAISAVDYRFNNQNNPEFSVRQLDNKIILRYYNRIFWGVFGAGVAVVGILIIVCIVRCNRGFIQKFLQNENKCLNSGLIKESCIIQ